MKVEYPIQLFNSFNKSIWTNKVFSYFLIALIICYTVILRKNPDIYYKYIFNPVVLLLIVFCILIIAKYNRPLGFMLIVSIIALYYPSEEKFINNIQISENFENIQKEDKEEKVKIPIPGEDKNIVDDSPKKKLTKKVDKKKSTKKDEDSETEEDQDDDEEDKDEEDTEKFSNDKDDEVTDIGLEKLNPGYYKKKQNNSDKKANKNKNTSPTKDSATKDSKKTNNLPKKTSNGGESETFLGDVRNVMKDLDTGKGGMNAMNAVKKINSLFYNKHKNNIQKILQADDDEDEESEDDDFF
jgi:hypothetical protein